MIDTATLLEGASTAAQIFYRVTDPYDLVMAYEPDRRELICLARNDARAAFDLLNEKYPEQQIILHWDENEELLPGDWQLGQTRLPRRVQFTHELVSLRNPTAVDNLECHRLLCGLVCALTNIAPDLQIVCAGDGRLFAVQFIRPEEIKRRLGDDGQVVFKAIYDSPDNDPMATALHGTPLAGRAFRTLPLLESNGQAAAKLPDFREGSKTPVGVPLNQAMALNAKIKSHGDHCSICRRTFEDGDATHYFDLAGQINLTGDCCQALALGEKIGDGLYQAPKPAFPDGLPLFELSKDVCNAMSEKARVTTLKYLADNDKLRTGFSKFAVRFYWPDVDPLGNDAFVTFAVDGPVKIDPRDNSRCTAPMHNLVEKRLRKPPKFENGISFCLLGHDKPETVTEVEFKDYHEGEEGKDKLFLVHDCTAALTDLIIALNTRNTVWTTSENPRKKMLERPAPEFRGPLRSVYIKTTRVERPDREEGEKGTHRSPHMHPRRPHEHTYHFGSGRRETKKIWLPLIWVNGIDPDMERRSYVVVK
jgi:hypothetical protein